MKVEVGTSAGTENGGADSGGAQRAPGSPSGVTRWVLLGAGALLLLVPVAMYFAFIHEYGVNAIYYDQWENIGLLTHTRFFFHSYSHTTAALLWAQHGEDRMFFPNLVVLALGHLTSFNIMIEMYTSGVLLVLALTLVIVAHRQDVPRIPLVLYVPAAFLVLTFGQIENTLFGFNLWLYMVIAALATTIFLLDLPRWGWVVCTMAIVTAVVGSYSALDGLAIWPAGLVVLLWRGRPRRFVLTWLIAAVTTAAVFFYHYQFAGTGANGGGPGYVFGHPLSGLEFFFYAVGSLAGGPLPLIGGSDFAIVAIGVVIVVLAVACVTVAVHRRRLGLPRSPVGPALICFGLLLAIVVTIGRANLGPTGAGQSRYVTEDLLTLVGAYLCLLDGWPVLDRESVAAGLAAATGAFRRDVPRVESTGGLRRQGWVLAVGALTVLVIVVEVVGGIEGGLRNGGADRSLNQRAQLVAANAACAPDSLIKSALFPNGGYVWSNVRALAVAAKKDHLSFFATSEASKLERAPLPDAAQMRPQTSVLEPTKDAVVHGTVLLAAGAQANCAIKWLRFEITNATGQRVQVVDGSLFVYGFVAGWLTSAVPNGRYAVQSTVRDSGGQTGTSVPVYVNVAN